MQLWVCWYENDLWSASLLTHCYLEAAELDSSIDPEKFGLESKVQYFSCYVKGTFFRQFGAPNIVFTVTNTVAHLSSKIKS